MFLMRCSGLDVARYQGATAPPTSDAEEFVPEHLVVEELIQKQNGGAELIAVVEGAGGIPSIGTSSEPRWGDDDYEAIVSRARHEVYRHV